MKLISQLFILFVIIQVCVAWSIDFYSGKDQTGKKLHYSSGKGKTDCFAIDKPLYGKVKSFRWCSIYTSFCDITFYQNENCKGERLGGAESGCPDWRKNTSPKGSTMKSFRVNGCSGVLSLSWKNLGFGNDVITCTGFKSLYC
jgi:hypothetical protein